MRDNLPVNLNHLLPCPTRADIYVARILNCSRKEANLLIKNHLVNINNQIILKPSFILQGEIHIIINNKIPNPHLTIIKEEQNFNNLTIEIIHEDEDYIIINKPPLINSCPSNELDHYNILNYLMHKNISLSEKRNGLIHRLDKETSGILIYAKSNAAHDHLSAQFKHREVKKIYLGIINKPLKNEGIIRSEIKKTNNNLTMYAKKINYEYEVKEGKYAQSTFKNLEIGKEDKTLISINILTGRMHQIRAQLANENRYLLGDTKYAPKNILNKCKCRMMLHAFILTFKHINQQEMTFYATIFNDMKGILNDNFTAYNDIISAL